MLPGNSTRKRLKHLIASLVLVVSLVVITTAYRLAAPQAHSLIPKKQLPVILLTIASRPTTNARYHTHPYPAPHCRRLPGRVTPTPTLLPAPTPPMCWEWIRIQGNILQALAGYAWAIEPVGLVI